MWPALSIHFSSKKSENWLYIWRGMRVFFRKASVCTKNSSDPTPRRIKISIAIL